MVSQNTITAHHRQHVTLPSHKDRLAITGVLPIAGLFCGDGSMPETKVCSKCKEEKAIEEFPFRKKKGRAWRRAQCRECLRAMSRSRGYDLSPERKEKKRIAARHRYYCCPRSTNRKSRMYHRMSRAKVSPTGENISDGTVTADSIAILLSKQNNRCAVSGTDLRYAYWAIDHIWPKIKGGLNSLNNVQLVTIKVNNIKSSVIPWEYCHKIPQGWFN